MPSASTASQATGVAGQTVGSNSSGSRARGARRRRRRRRSRRSASRRSGATAPNRATRRRRSPAPAHSPARSRRRSSTPRPKASSGDAGEAQQRAHQMRPAQPLAGQRRGQQHDQQRPEIVDQVRLGRRRELERGEIERVVAEQAADAEQPDRRRPAQQVAPGQRRAARARTMPIAAPMAKVMATIWKGGIGPARHRQGRERAPQRDGAEARRHRPAPLGGDTCHQSPHRQPGRIVSIGPVTIAVTAGAACSIVRPTRSAIASRASPSIVACVAALTVAACGPAASLSRHRPRPRADRLPLRLLSRRRRDRAGARDHRADAAGRPPARLRRGRAGAGDRRRRRLGAGAAGCCRRAARRASTTSRPTPPTRRRMVVTQQMRQRRRQSAGLSRRGAAALQRAAYPDIAPIVLDRRRRPRPSSKVDRGRDGAGLGRRGARAGRRPHRGGRHLATGSASRTTSWSASAPRARGSRIDIRSKSRVGVSDFGANARRIRAFSERLRQPELRSVALVAALRPVDAIVRAAA